MSAGGCPYLSIDFGDGVERIVPLPPGGTRHELQRLAFGQVAVWRRPFALVFSPEDVLRFDENGGSVKVGPPPRTPWVLVGRIVASTGPSEAAELQSRHRHLDAFAARQSKGNAVGSVAPGR